MTFSLNPFGFPTGVLEFACEKGPDHGDLRPDGRNDPSTAAPLET